jgi:hypothetical protein
MGDGLSDQWEYGQFGHYAALAGEDPDGDGYPNAASIWPIPCPQTATSALARDRVCPVTGAVQLLFVTSTARCIACEALAGDLR